MHKPVILGAGLAGLSAALALAPMPVRVVSPRVLGEGCSSAWAQGGIASALGTDDSAELHAVDTLAAGAGLNDADIVRQVTNDGRNVIDRLAALGAPFDYDDAGNLRLGLEAAHQKRRIVHARDATGLAVMQAIIAAAYKTPSIEILENATAEDLIVGDNGIEGVILQRGDERHVLSSHQVILASGGAAALWRDTTNPHENWGSGLALAARVGATLGDLEFMQFHPTAIDCGRDPMPLASEALRGEGALLVDENGTRFTEELQPRDIVTRAIWAQISAGHRVFLDARPVENFPTRFPTIYELCRDAGIDPTRTPIPVCPAAHYHMGGVITDGRGRTDINGLWACGEVACTGLHGANRLASNSLLEAASFGARVANDLKGMPSLPLRSTEALAPFVRGSGKRTHRQKQSEIRQMMSDDVGVIRTRTGLDRATTFLSSLATISDIALVGLMIAVSALKREESRGSHFRSDFPQKAAQAQRSVFKLSDLEDFR